MTTVGELEALLTHHGMHDDEVTMDVQTQHNNRQTGIYVRVALCVNGTELITMVADNRNRNSA